jgi:hypothetical protein
VQPSISSGLRSNTGEKQHERRHACTNGSWQELIHHRLWRGSDELGTLRSLPLTRPSVGGNRHHFLVRASSAAAVSLALPASTSLSAAASSVRKRRATRSRSLWLAISFSRMGMGQGRVAIASSRVEDKSGNAL